MATKKDLFNEALAAGRVAEDSSADDYTVQELEALLGADTPVSTGPVPQKPIVSPVDGHVVLSQEDIDARQ